MIIRVLGIAVVLMILLGTMRTYGADPIAPDLVRTVELTWDSVGEVGRYELELSTDPNFESILYSEKVDGRKFQVDLLPGAYFYRVRALDSHGRPGRWTPVTELSINARPPVLLWPQHEEVVRGNLPDSGLPLRWRASGPGIRYLIEIRSADENGEFTQTVARQEVTDDTFPFFPQDIGRYQWSVHTLGAAGDEPGSTWVFEIEGVYPRDATPDQMTKKIVRYISPWWRNHWWYYARYGQAQLSFTVIDQELGGTGQVFNALTGYINQMLYWEWHDPVAWTKGGVPWFALEFELQRQTLLTESTVLHSKSVHFGSWYEKVAKGWRFSPVIEFGNKILAIYQARKPTEAARSNSTRYRLAGGLALEYKLKPFLTLGGSAKANIQFGGLSGLATINGDQLNLNLRPGNLKSAVGYEFLFFGSMLLSPRMKAEARVRYQTDHGSWVPRFYAPRGPNDPPIGDSTVDYKNITFDLSIGFKF